MNDIVTGNFASRGRGHSAVIGDACHQLEYRARTAAPRNYGFLASQNADLLTLQEVDLNARRTRRLNIAEEIARRLGMNYVFGREFEELTQGFAHIPGLPRPGDSLAMADYESAYYPVPASIGLLASAMVSSAHQPFQERHRRTNCIGN